MTRHHTRTWIAAALATTLITAIVAAQRNAFADLTVAEHDVPRLVEALELKPGMTVADVGAGFGAMTTVLSKWIGPSGRVYATDIAQAQLDALRKAAADNHLTNVSVVEGAERATNLPESCCDAIFMRDVYHHITDPAAFDRSLFQSLRPGGRLAIIDFEPRPNSTLPAGVPANRGGHGIKPPIVVDEFTAAGFTHVKTIAKWPEDTSDSQFFLVLFRKPAAGAVADAARPLPLTAVRLIGGPLKRAQDADAKDLLALEPDRMLAYYRQRAGLTPKAQPYGGWDGDGRNLTGHIAGHYLSAVSLMWAATGDVRFKARADYIVSELKAVQDKHGDGYLSALAGLRNAFAQLSAGTIRSASFDLNGEWSPWYTLHKTFAGLRDAYRYAGNADALQVEIKFAGWAERVLAPLSDAQLQQMLNTEFGGMQEVLADLYADTSDPRWLTLSHKFDHRAFLDPLLRGEDRLSGLHGNTQIPKMVAAAARYGYAGDHDDLVEASFFWNRVVDHHTFPTGGHGKDEYFREPDMLSHIVDGRTAETCNVYNMLKLTRRLFALQPDVRYAEFQERALFNHILGSLDPDDGAMCYMVGVGRFARREYQDMARSFTCCVGSGLESHALHGYGIYYESGDRLWVNLYAPTIAKWDAAGVQLRMDTTFPEGDTASVTITAASPKAFTLALRRPSWAGNGFAVTVNGAAEKNLPKPGSYVELKRTWKTGDVVALRLPKALRLESTPDDPRTAAVMWGPLVLAGDLGPEPARGAARGTTADGAATVFDTRAMTAAPPIVAAARPVTDWVKPDTTRPGAFRTSGVGRDVQLVPFFELHRRMYAAYWDLFTPAEFTKHEADVAAERARQARLQAATVGFVAPGDQQSERDGRQQGEETSIVRVDGRAGRRAGKWFSYDVAVDPTQPDALVVTYNSDTRRARSFAIVVDGTRVADQNVPESSVSKFFDVEYPLPADVVSGKPRVTVRFEAASGNEVAPVFGVRVVWANR